MLVAMCHIFLYVSISMTYRFQNEMLEQTQYKVYQLFGNREIKHSELIFPLLCVQVLVVKGYVPFTCVCALVVAEKDNRRLIYNMAG